ncbi:MAG: class B sortase [Oscillospiraceae bacterium]
MKTKKEHVVFATLLAVMAVMIVGLFTLIGVHIYRAPRTATEVVFATPAPVEQNEVKPHSKEDFAPFVSRELKEAYNRNSDVIGWLTVPGCDIDDEVVQSYDNDFYLRRTSFSSDYDVWGCYFLDYINNADRRASLDLVSIIYGHALDDYSDSKKFSTLKHYKSPSFAAEHPVISFNLLYEKLEFELFAACDIPITIDYIDPNPDSAKFASTFNYMLSNSYCDFGVKVSEQDRLLLLSTCTSNHDVRFVVAGKLKK